MTVQLPITRVTVHPDGATVTRSGVAVVEDGHVRVRHLPLLLEPPSLRVAVRGGTLRQSRLDLDLPFTDRAAEQAEAALLREKKAELAAIEAEIEGLDQVRRTLALGFTEVDSERPAPDAALLGRWMDVADALDGWSERVDGRSAALKLERNQMQQQVQKIERSLKERSTEAVWQRWAPTRQLDLKVEGDTVEVEVSYTLAGARWTPAYGIDLERDLSRGRFAMRALVAQATGEDWTGVAVTVTTAPRGRLVDLPALAALRLGTVQPPRPTGWRPLPADLDGLFPHDPPPPIVEPEPEAPMEEAYFDAEDDGVWAAGGAPEPPPLPRAMATRSSTGAISGVLGAMADMLPQVQSHEPQRSMAAPPMPPAAMKRRRAAPRKPEAPRPSSYGVADDQLDYARLRVLGPDAGPGRRGRLEAMPEERLFRERGLPDQAWSRWSDALRQLVEGTHLLRERPMPPHHVVPGPIADLDVAFDVTGSLDVPSDGRFHAANVFQAASDVQIRYRAVPRSDTRVFRRVQANVPRTGPLPPGPLEASIEGALEITAPFAGNAGDAAIGFGLGAEDGLTLSRNVRYDETSAGLLGGSRRFRTAFRVEIASALDRDVHVELLERIPVPLKDDTPIFEICDASPPTEAWKGDEGDPILKGGRRQRLTVRAGATATATLTYEVVLSNKEELTGGDRRG